MEKRFRDLGLIGNFRKNENGKNYLTILKDFLGKDISDEDLSKDLDDFVGSSDFSIEYLDGDGAIVENEADSLAFRFRLPWESKYGTPVYGLFTRKSKDLRFVGVKWESESLNDFGNVRKQSLGQLNEMSGENITDIRNVSYSNVTYYNGAGYTKYPDGTPVSKGTAKYIIFSTPYKNKDEHTQIVGWFTFNNGKMQGISWGTEEDFKKHLQLGSEFHSSIGRMKFADLRAVNAFLKQVADKCMPEVWAFKDKNGHIGLPILKSYLENELDRLYYEKDVLGANGSDASYKDRIVYNQDRTYAMFNTNLINTFGQDLIIMGKIIGLGGEEYLSDLTVSPSVMQQRMSGYTADAPKPKVPEFFKDINDIVFHVEWVIDTNMNSYNHIIKKRRERFPVQYQEKANNILGTILDSSIKLSQNIARRNYKFIVPMYYPEEHRIQLLMPIYLDGEYTRHPDFALILTPHPEQRIYTPETILGLNEVYMDARLIAKPETSWLNPEIIDGENTD